MRSARPQSRLATVPDSVPGIAPPVRSQTLGAPPRADTAYCQALEAHILAPKPVNRCKRNPATTSQAPKAPSSHFLGTGRAEPRPNGRKRTFRKSRGPRNLEGLPETCRSIDTETQRRKARRSKEKTEAEGAKQRSMKTPLRLKRFCRLRRAF